MEDADDPRIIGRHLRDMRKSCEITGHAGLAAMCVKAAETIETLVAQATGVIANGTIVCARDKESGLYHATTGERDYLTQYPTDAMDRSALMFEKDANLWGEAAELVEFEVLTRPTGRTSKTLYQDGRAVMTPNEEEEL